MMQLLKWFWLNLSIKSWTFEKRPLARLDLIFRRIIFYPFLVIFKYAYLMAVLCGWGLSDYEHEKITW
jgi:hypothetical protein